MNSQRWWKLQTRLAPYLFVAPFVIVFLLFMLYPLARSIILSFQKTAGPRTSRFVGFEHYAWFFKDRLFLVAILNTILYAVVYLALQIPLSLGLAVLLNNPRTKLRNFFRFAFFSSHLVGHVFVAIIFMLLLSPRNGLLLKLAGWFYPPWGDVNWLQDPINARLAVIIANLWLNVGWGMIFFLAALQSVDPELYEAAEMDGAGSWSRFRQVTLPGIWPVAVFLIIAGTIGAFQLFELPYLIFMQQGSSTGPGFAGLTLVSYLYQNGFEIGDLGAAAALGWLMVFLIMGVAFLQIRTLKFAREDNP